MCNKIHIERTLPKWPSECLFASWPSIRCHCCNDFDWTRLLMGGDIVPRPRRQTERDRETSFSQPSRSSMEYISIDALVPLLAGLELPVGCRADISANQIGILHPAQPLRREVCQRGSSQFRLPFGCAQKSIAPGYVILSPKLLSLRGKGVHVGSTSDH